MIATNSIYGGTNSSTGVAFEVERTDPGNGSRLYPVTGMWSGINVNNGYLAGFGVYPPGTTTDITSNADLRGSKLEWYVTGCTMTFEPAAFPITYYSNIGGDWSNYSIAVSEDRPICTVGSTVNLTNVPFTATPTTTLYSKFYLTGTTWDTPFVQSLSLIHI